VNIALHVLQADARGTTRSAVAALLDGATPLHAAALRGNPAQIDHLLFCKADPMARTAAGDYPFELVPICADKVSGMLYIVSHIPAFQVCCVLSLSYICCASEGMQSVANMRKNEICTALCNNSRSLKQTICWSDSVVHDLIETGELLCYAQLGSSSA